MFVCWLTLATAFAQTAPPAYHQFVKLADSLYTVKAYENAGLNYSAAFQSFGGLGYADHRYKAARAWSMAGNADSAFYNLQRIVDRANYTDVQQITTDPALKSLQGDERWEKLMVQVRENNAKKEALAKSPLVHLIDSMRVEDQKWRKAMRELKNGELRSDALTKNDINRRIFLTDSLIYFVLKNIFDTCGFPNYDLVGQEGSYSFWLLVQHQDRHPEFQESVLAKMKIEVDANKASGANYAYLLDRVKINTGQPQVYGTQMELNAEKTSYVPKNVIEPEKLNERRASMGLGTIESYTESMNSRYFGSLKKKPSATD